MTYAELTRRLRALGPNHPGDLPKGTLAAILKQLGIRREDVEGE